MIFSQVDLVLLSNGLINLEFPESFEDNSKTIRQNILQQGFLTVMWLSAHSIEMRNENLLQFFLVCVETTSFGNKIKIG